MADVYFAVVVALGLDAGIADLALNKVHSVIHGVLNDALNLTLRFRLDAALGEVFSLVHRTFHFAFQHFFNHVFGFHACNPLFRQIRSGCHHAKRSQCLNNRLRPRRVV